MDIKFGTGGFRGIIGNDFTLETVFKITSSVINIIFANNLKPEVVVGYDRRKLSKESSEVVAATCLSKGIKVYLLDTDTPSPTTMYFTKKYDVPFGFMITASHNNGTYNGVKIFTQGGFDADVSTTSLIEKEIDKIHDISIPSLNRNDPNLNLINAINRYVDNLLDFIPFKINKDLKIAYDNLYGTGIGPIQNLFDKLGINLISFNTGYDYSFGGKIPNPIEENLQDLKKYVLENKLDFAFSCDSDADRLAIIDNNGNYISMNDILGVVYYFLIKYKGYKGPIIKNLTTSSFIDCLAEKLNEQCITVDVGFKNITRAMKEYEALLGGESSGGFTMRDYIPGKDATYGILIFMALVSQINLPVSEIVKQIRKYANFDLTYRSYNFDFNKGLKETMRKHLLSFECDSHLEIINIFRNENNLKWTFNNNQWLCIRLSGTEPAIRINMELQEEDAKFFYDKILRHLEAVKE